MSLAVIAVAVFSGNSANAQAVIDANPDNIDFYGHEFLADSLSDTVNIQNNGEGDLNWAASWSEVWLTAIPASGTAPSSLTIKVSPETLVEGDYIDTIWIESVEASNSPFPIEVFFDVNTCLGMCGDANNDGTFNISDAVWIIGYIFVGGPQPIPVKACGDANGDGFVNVSDVVWIIIYVFLGGPPADDCSPGSWEGQGGDCCPFES
jgi:hypothetical protein